MLCKLVLKAKQREPQLLFYWVVQGPHGVALKKVPVIAQGKHEDAYIYK